MKVKELIKILLKQDQERIVVMSKDSEGNVFSPFSDISICSYQAENSYCGYVGLEKLTKKDIENGYGEEDVVYGEPAVCLWPTN